jgi:hypothetical protein
MEKDALSEYLLSQTSIRDYLGFQEFVTLFPADVRTPEDGNKTIRKVYHGLVSQDLDRHELAMRNLENFVVRLQQVHSSEQQDGEEEFKPSVDSRVGQSKIDMLADALVDSFDNRFTRELEEETNSNLVSLQKIIDELKSIEVPFLEGSEPGVFATVTEEVDSLRRNIESIKRA